ncbi:MAG: hypothetical protein IID41_02575 [Planctomycetes bacterium]|nr:hypothetical protein [Planctomycetota bacterium]
MNTVPAASSGVNPAGYGYGFGTIAGPITAVGQTVPNGTQRYSDTQRYSEILKEAPASGVVGFKEEVQEDDDSELLKRCLVEGTNSPLAIGRHIAAALWSCDVGADYPEWKSPLWDFVWRLKLHPKLKAYTAMKALRSVERYADDLEDCFDELDLDEIREDFQECWDKMLFLPGWGLLEYALAMADEVPLSVQPDERRTASYERFISYAGWLQVCHGNKPILLPCRKTAELMFGSDSKRTRISRYVGWAIEDVYLKRVFIGGLKALQADAYRFAVGRWTCLEKKARPGCAAAFDRAEHRKQRFFGHRECEDSSS